LFDKVLVANEERCTDAFSFVEVTLAATGFGDWNFTALLTGVGLSFFFIPLDTVAAVSLLKSLLAGVLIPVCTDFNILEFTLEALVEGLGRLKSVFAKESM